ncbi:MOSC N-terminal beta barrel domain-containing protein [Alcaligenaceae bacterium]|nr:MOSC N-terminal beta barrel domain-containing protein [Alcaligenaceae bacterium]
MSITVLSLHSYPVKSCAGLSHDTINLTQAGLAFDREWVLVDWQGVFMTQRQYPRMALIQPTLAASLLSLNAPGMPALSIASPPDSPATPPVSVRIWGSDTLGRDEGDTAAQWLSQFMGTPCRLLRVHPHAKRNASPEHVNAWRHKHHDTEPAFPAQHTFGFADGFPFLIANQGSLDELNRQLIAKGESAVPMNRFRPNIVLQGLDAYEEDYLTSLGIGGLTFALVKRCARCPIPNIDQATALSAPEPGLTLAAHRQFPEGVLFGVNAVVSGTTASSCISTGDTVEPAYDF